MGLAYAKARICNLRDWTRFQEKELLVDTGAVYSMVSRVTLEQIGVKPRRRRFRSANGQEFEREVGMAVFDYEGIITTAPVIFGEEGDEEVLGVLTLEGLGLQVDPVTGQLRPMELLMVLANVQQCAAGSERKAQARRKTNGQGEV